jgi:threonine dehydratase
VNTPGIHAAEASTAPTAVGPAVELVCTGCGRVVGPQMAFPTRCPDAVAGDDVDHVLARRVDPAAVRFLADDDPEPFVRFRELSRAFHLARAAGWSDERFVDLVHRLDRAVATVDGHGFRVTPFERADVLSERLGFTADGGVWIKDETGGVGGSHKARHLMGILLALLVAEETDPAAATHGPLAIASCGNAALAAAVVAHAAARRLDVFVPPDADPVVLGRLEHLHARVEAVPREPGETGDPTVRRLGEALAAGAVPFTCQGPANGLAIEGGATLAWELAGAMAATGTPMDRLVVQVGGGALASACAVGLREARDLGVIASLPAIDTVQTQGAWPLRRAWDLLVERLAADGVAVGGPLDPEDPVVAAVLADAARHRSDYMWPWATEPHSVARGILDDETYDWYAIVRAMLETGGRPIVVDEDRLREANDLAHQLTTIDADETGTAGLAGVLDLLARGDIRPEERVAVLFTGIRRGSPALERSRT